MSPLRSTVLPLLAFLLLVFSMASADLSALPADPNSMTLAPASPITPISKPNGTHFKKTWNRLHARLGQDKPKELTGAVLNNHYCFSKGDKYGVSRTEIMDAAYVFCFEDNPSDDPWAGFDFNDANGRDESWFERDGGAAIEVAAMLIDGCLAASDEDVQVMGDFTCYDIAFGAWDKCYGNGGRGGAIDVGCVRYNVRPYWNKEGDLSVVDWDANEMDKDIIEGVDC